MRLLLTAATALMLAVPCSPAQDPPKKKAEAGAADKDKVKMDAETKVAIDKALKWLKDQQDPKGAWGNTAITSFIGGSLMFLRFLPLIVLSLPVAELLLDILLYRRYGDGFLWWLAGSGVAGIWLLRPKASMHSGNPT